MTIKNLKNCNYILVKADYQDPYSQDFLNSKKIPDLKLLKKLVEHDR